VTNQPDIERQIIDVSFVNELHEFYQKKYDLDAIYLCPFASNEHPLKKPNPGMFLQAKSEMGLDLSKSFLLGDTEKDTLAAQKCGIQSILWNRSYNSEVTCSLRVNSVEEVLNALAST
jgi:D-glycero-D-manno-heptose 1,7-bisphosphate phosphatase